VAVHKRTEEEQKDLIFDIFSKCRRETASSRLQVHSSILCEQVFLWHKVFLSADVDKMGLEIVNVINRFTNAETISKIPEDKDGFFKYLAVSIESEKAASFREYNEEDKIKIPKEKKRKLREAEDFIRMTESQLGRKLTNDEQTQCISKWFKKQEYVDLLKVKNVGGLYIGNNENGETNILDSVITRSDPTLDDYINKTDIETLRKAVQSVLNKKQKRSRDCYRALFTLHCVEKIKDYEGLYPVLDKNVLEICKDGKNPNQYEIYQDYHPKAKKSGAEAMASKNLKEFLKDIKTCLKNK